MPNQPAKIAAIRRRAGGSLVEILIVVLILGLVAAAMMTRVMEKNEKLQKATSGEADAADLAELLGKWTSDPQALEDELADGRTSGPTTESTFPEATRPESTRPDASFFAPPSHDARPLDTPEEQQAYQDLVDHLKESDQLEAWKGLLREELGPDHPLLVALEAQPNGSAEDAVELRWSDETANFAAHKDDPDIHWADGEPVRFVVDG